MQKESINLFETRKPTLSEIRNHIDYYYFDQRTSGESKNFIFYPHYKRALTIYKNMNIQFYNYKTISKPSCTESYTCLYARINTIAHQTSITPPFNKIGIVFNPLGLNHFLKEPLSKYLDGYRNQEFTYFYGSLFPALDKIYSTNSIESKVEALDKFFLSCIEPFEQNHLQKAIEIIHASDTKLSVQNISDRIGVSRKTLLRLFKLHLGCTVKDYLKVVQFRKAVDLFQASNEVENLTSLSYASGYYDQSELIKQFKKLTGFNPSNFFKDLKNVSAENTFWSFITKNK